MTNCETYLNEILKIVDRDNVGIFEATATFCAQNDLDEKEFIAQLDANALALLKTGAVKEGYVRKCVWTPPKTLDFM